MIRERLRERYGVEPGSWDLSAPDGETVPTGAELRTRDVVPPAVPKNVNRTEHLQAFPGVPALEPIKASNTEPLRPPTVPAIPAMRPPALPFAAPPPAQLFAEEPYTPPAEALDAPGAARRSLVDQLDRLRRQRHEAYVSKADPATILRWEQAEAKATSELAKLVGELTAADESKLAKTARWIELRTAILQALKRYPDAERAVLDALTEHNG